MPDDDDGSSPTRGDGSGPWEPFVVPRALDALLGDVRTSRTDAHLQRATRRGGVRADARQEWLAGNAFDRFVGQPRSNEDDEEEDDEEEEAAGRRPNKPNACLMVVTTDNDLAPCLRRWRAAGIRVVVCGDYPPSCGAAPVERPRRGGGQPPRIRASG